MLINSFHVTQSISKILSPSEIVLKQSLIFEKHAKGLFGSYVEINKQAVITNTNCGHKITGILLGPTGNIQGIQKVFDIRTGVIKKCRTIRNLPMPQAVIKSLRNWSKLSAHKKHQHNLVFLDQNKERCDWDNGDISDNAGNTENNPSPLNNISVKLPGIDMEIDHNDTSAVTPEIDQPDAERIQDTRTNSILIPEGNTGRSAGADNLFYKTLLGVGNTIGVP